MLMVAETREYEAPAKNVMAAFTQFVLTHFQDSMNQAFGFEGTSTVSHGLTATCPKDLYNFRV